VDWVGRPVADADNGTQPGCRRPSPLGNEPMHPVDRLESDPTALLQPAHQLAVVDRLAAEGCLGDFQPPASLVDLCQEDFGVGHGLNAANSLAAVPSPG